MLVEARVLGRTFQQAGTAVLALRDVDLRIASGELVVVSGRSGSGKSTLLALLGALDQPSSGSLHLLGVQVESASPSRLSRLRQEHVGFVFQDFRLVRHLSALDNVRLPLLFAAGASQEGAPEQLLDTFQLAHRMRHRPGQLSRGEMQRVALARALVNSPDILIADEPTANLDSENASILWELILALNQRDGLTVVVATHDSDRAPASARIVRLEEGRVVSDDGA